MKEEEAEVGEPEQMKMKTLFLAEKVTELEKDNRLQFETLDVVIHLFVARAAQFYSRLGSAWPRVLAFQ